MIRTPVCDLLQIEHPIALGGMGSVSGPALTAAVSNAGGLGAMGCHYMYAEQIRIGTGLIREQTNKALALPVKRWRQYHQYARAAGWSVQH
jgi:enoyl-[acyl-carrier protein] reductase II